MRAHWRLCTTGMWSICYLYLLPLKCIFTAAEAAFSPYVFIHGGKKAKWFTELRKHTGDIEHLAAVLYFVSVWSLQNGRSGLRYEATNSTKRHEILHDLLPHLPVPFALIQPCLELQISFSASLLIHYFFPWQFPITHNKNRVTAMSTGSQGSDSCILFISLPAVLVH